jgi:retron-type reverse transcriptase
MRKRLDHVFEEAISVENLLAAWREFRRGKRARWDVQEFGLRLTDNIFELHDDLAHHTYHHGPYQAFKVSDPKARDIHKATVRDRLLHRALYRALYPFFDRSFIADSYSCRRGKGCHAALRRFRRLSYKMSKNGTRTCWVLKCDIRKYFASIDHAVLRTILRRHIADARLLDLLEEVIGSFASRTESVGLPLGNVTSQLLANIYLNELDRFVKLVLGGRHYIRYGDDFVLLSDDRGWLEAQLPRIREFLERHLRLALHPRKVSIGTLAAGVDFLGWVHFMDHRVLRTTTKRRMLKRVGHVRSDPTVASYLGLLRHGNAYTLSEAVRRIGGGGEVGGGAAW